jgi:hypothetical protein
MPPESSKSHLELLGLDAPVAEWAAATSAAWASDAPVANSLANR